MLDRASVHFGIREAGIQLPRLRCAGRERFHLPQMDRRKWQNPRLEAFPEIPVQAHGKREAKWSRRPSVAASCGFVAPVPDGGATLRVELSRPPTAPWHMH